VREEQKLKKRMRAFGHIHIQLRHIKLFSSLMANITEEEAAGSQHIASSGLKTRQCAATSPKTSGQSAGDGFLIDHTRWRATVLSKVTGDSGPDSHSYDFKCHWLLYMEI
jgi:hypothetical protein